ncbi:hypothetical protein RRG08_044408 [Elysia crispata]|uniref:Uncharacterized protein n=1 Tax=Elysia crispata TaxID=231223 RepID=A0AAE1DMG5_9GAST|nr:hypothetical protein RRG08_044408 [Elysia crispata]
MWIPITENRVGGYLTCNPIPTGLELVPVPLAYDSGYFPSTILILTSSESLTYRQSSSGLGDVTKPRKARLKSGPRLCPSLIYLVPCQRSGYPAVSHEKACWRISRTPPSLVLRVL